MDRLETTTLSKKEIILKEAFRLFFQKGYDAVSVTDLVQAAHSSRGNMFHHFKNKEDIFIHVVQKFIFDLFDEDIQPGVYKSETPLKDFIMNQIGNIEKRMEYLEKEYEGSITASNFLSFLLYIKERYPEWNDKFLSSEQEKTSMWHEIVELSKQRGEIKSDVDATQIISIFRNIFVGLSYREALTHQLSLEVLMSQISYFYSLIKK